MKHIKKKTLNELVLPLESIENIPKELHPDMLKNKKYSELKDSHVILISESGRTTRAFLYNNNGVNCAVPLIDPILLYYNEAYNSYKRILDDYSGQSVPVNPVILCQ